MSNAHESHLPKTEQDRLDYERKASASRKEREHLDDYQAEMGAHANADSQEPDMTDSGKIRRHTRPRKKYALHKEKEHAELSALFGVSAVSEVLKNIFNSSFEYLAALAAAPSHGVVAKAVAPAKAINPLYPYEDQNFAFEFTKVSEQTAREMERETEIINAKVEEMEAATHLDRKHILARQIVSLAEEFRMREHPRTRVFVHEIEAVQIMESKYNPDGGEVLCDAEVCFVRLKCTPAESRGIKRGISDVYNQAVAEIELTRAEQTALEAARPAPIAPAPHLA